MNELQVANKVIMFGFNYPSNFIQLVWSDDTHTANHLESKANGYYETHKTDWFFTFYCNLDAGNKAKLVNWILANYKG